MLVGNYRNLGLYSDRVKAEINRLEGFPEHRRTKEQQATYEDLLLRWDSIDALGRKHHAEQQTLVELYPTKQGVMREIMTSLTGEGPPAEEWLTEIDPEELQNMLSDEFNFSPDPEIKLLIIGCFLTEGLIISQTVQNKLLQAIDDEDPRVRANIYLFLRNKGVEVHPADLMVYLEAETDPAALMYLCDLLEINRATECILLLKAKIKELGSNDLAGKNAAAVAAMQNALRALAPNPSS